MSIWKNAHRLWDTEDKMRTYLLLFCLLFVQGFSLKINENIGGKMQFWKIFGSFFSFKGLHCSILFYFILFYFIFYFILPVRAVRCWGVQTLPRSNLDGISFFLSMWFSNFKCLCLWYPHRCGYEMWRKPWKPAVVSVTRRITKLTARKKKKNLL